MITSFVQIEKLLPERLIDGGIGRKAKTKAQQTDGAMRDFVARNRKRGRRAPGFGKKLIQHRDEIGCCISKSPVEIK